MTTNQWESGAFVASPDFPQYQFCWLRDGSFVAYALDRSGEHQASHRFHEWCASSVDGISSMMEAAIKACSGPQRLDASSLPPARFSLDGRVVRDDWPNFQIDGYGTWLWSLHEHLQRGDHAGLPASWGRPVERTALYLSAVGEGPCFDVWEEHGTAVHTSTLAAVIAGLDAAARMLGEPAFTDRAAEVRSRLTDQARVEGRFEKSSESHEVDASLLWLAEPYHVVDALEPSYVQTVTEVGGALDLDGGIRRYPTDTYYGGGAWPVLTASLGWQRVAVGDCSEGLRRHEWVAHRFDVEGRLGEQFGGEERDPAMHAEWVRRWGPPAQDLLWSHAMFVILSDELRAANSVSASKQASSVSD
jgi:GH15 family glucan-1,4-alpha-glucosidase